ncbi:hypothetical protein FLK61_36490 [Paenalkalicoccus suaedae]|uniref:Uncharacterized protein n=1 Tax=Paenalkalicoccus suaedae TaxID=2592382 RepID=A0A859FH53_9BACI|nr:hypothetical protein [Paenalkalicoccus suaedae]QKS72158.1 hypothetical protein FLK61_36490 [Paenalkalicoccus suaedae]
MAKEFELKFSHPFWQGDPNADLCSHGEVYLRICETVLVEPSDGEWNLNESALSLLRSVVMDFPRETVPDYYPVEIEKEEALLFHCGCFMLFCPINIGFHVHHMSDKVKLSHFHKDDGEEELPYHHVELSLKDYANEIYTFAKEAKKFFDNQPKCAADVELFEGQYQVFWNEYNVLLGEVEELVSKL